MIPATPARRKSNFLSVKTLPIAAVLLILTGAFNSAAAQTFTNVYTSSGLSSIITANKTANPTWWVSSIQLADLDGDGDLDLYIGAHGTPGAMAVYNDGHGVFTQTSCTLTTTSNPEFHIAYDINEDGKLDACMTYTDGGAQWWRNQTATTNGAFPFQSTTITRDGNTSRLMAMVDINKDGKVDWIRFPQGNTFSFDLGDGTGNFTKNDNQLTVATGISNENFFFQAVDINNDGEIDLLGYTVAYTAVSGVSRVMQRNANLSFTDVTTSCGLTTASGFSIIGEADIDQDGDMDLIVLQNQSTLEAYINDGTGHFTKKTGAFTNTGNLTLALADGGATFVDVDNDGIGDLVARGRSFLRVFRGTGGGNFTNMTAGWAIGASGWANPAFGDIDGDGDMDIIGYNDGGDHPSFWAFRNDLSTTNKWLNVRPVGAAGNKAAAGAKIRVFAPGTRTLLWYEQVMIGNHYSYYSFPKTERHFGLGTRTSCDVEVEFYPSGKKVSRLGVAANTTLTVDESTPAPPPPPPSPTPTPPPTASGKFTNVTASSGVQTIQNGFLAGDWVSGLNLVDLDGDNKLDLYVGMHDATSQPRAVAALNNGKGVFTKSVSNNYPKSEMHLPYDINEDGKLDISVTYQDGGSAWYLSQCVPGTLNYTATNITRVTNTARVNVLLDINKDGKVDWLRGATPGVVIDTGDGLGNFTAGFRTLDTGYNPDAQDTGIFPIDLDNTGTYSLALAWGGFAIPTGKTMLLRNDGNMNFTDVTATAGLPSDGCIKGIGDYNQDGYADILFLETNLSTWNIYLNDGAGHFVKKANAISGTVGSTSYAYGGLGVYTDFDNDGLGDLLVSWKYGQAILRGTGGGNFSSMTSPWTVSTQSKGDDGLCFGDIDGDGMLDIIAYNGNISVNPTHFDVYRNDLTKKNWINVRPVGLAGNIGAAGAKIRISVPGGPLLWSEQVQLIGKQMAANYYSFLQTERHFGLNARTKVDVSVQFYPSGKTITKRGVNVNSTIVIQEKP